MAQNIFENFVEHTITLKNLKGRDRTTPIFYLENYYKKTDEYFSMIPFGSSRLSLKIFLKILSSMPDHPKGRGRTKSLVSHMENNNLLSGKQHGFRKKRSCLTQLIDHVDHFQLKPLRLDMKSTPSI